MAVVLLDLNPDLGIAEIFFIALLQGLLQASGGQPGCWDVSEQRQRDHSVLAHWRSQGSGGDPSLGRGNVKEGDFEHVFGTDVIVGWRSRRLLQSHSGKGGVDLGQGGSSSGALGPQEQAALRRRYGAAGSEQHSHQEHQQTSD